MSEGGSLNPQNGLGSHVDWSRLLIGPLCLRWQQLMQRNGQSAAALVGRVYAEGGRVGGGRLRAFDSVCERPRANSSWRPRANPSWRM